MKKFQLNKKISIYTLTVLLAILFVFQYQFKVQAAERQAITNKEPSVKVEILKPEENSTFKVGDNIVVEGVVKPQPFEITTQNKEIVLVLDVSGSMKDNSKLANLKKAANSFVDKMQKVPNLKIGIVTYESSAKIQRKTIDKKSIAMIPANKVTELKSIISSLSANGGTNTGEGLRKGTYLLSNSTEQESAANKTVILMSDGMPTYYTDSKTDKWDSRNVNYFLDVTKEDGGYSNNSGSGSKDTSNLVDLNYAKEIGGSIKTNGYNVFTIGYGLGSDSSDGNKKMKAIHESMGGVVEGDYKTFFATDSGAIESVFNKIAENILDSYNINNVEMNLNLSTEAFELQIGDAVDSNLKINIPPIQYNKVSVDGELPIRYEGKDVPFKFVIKAKQEGSYNLFENAEVKFIWNGKYITANEFTNPTITIGPGEPGGETEVPPNSPDITAILNGNYNKTPQNNELVEVNYSIKPGEYTPENHPVITSNKKEIVFVVDMSDRMYRGWSKDKKKPNSDNKKGISPIEIVNEKINEYIDQYKNNENISIGVIGYNRNIQADIGMKSGSSIINLENTLISEWWYSDKKWNDNREKRNIENAIEKADKYFSQNEDSKSEKYMVLLNSKDIDDDDIAEDIETKNLNVISLAFDVSSGSSNFNKDYFYNFKKLYDDINNESRENYIECKAGKWSSNGSNFDIEGMYKQNRDTAFNSIWSKIGQVTSNGENQDLISKTTAKLTFNLGSKLELVDGLVKEDEKYTLTQDVIYTYDIASKKYKADDILINFTVKPKDYGIITFSNDNTIEGNEGVLTKDGNNLSYSVTYNANKKDVVKKIEVPILNVPNPVTHGIYGSYNNRNITLLDKDNEGLTLAQDANVTFGAQFNTSNASEQVKLYLDENIKLEGSPSVLIVDNNNKLKSIGNMEKKTDLEYSYQLKTSDFNEINKVNSNYTVVILYNVKLPDKPSTYTNKIKVNNVEKPASVKVGSEQLPNLF